MGRFRRVLVADAWTTSCSATLLVDGRRCQRLLYWSAATSGSAATSSIVSAMGESKVRMLIITGQLRSIKDGRSRRILPEWVEAYVQDRAKSTEDIW